MRQVVESVPSIEGQNRTQWVVFIPSGVEVLSFELFGVKAFDQSSPAVVYAFKNLQTAFHIGIHSVGHFGPLVLIIVQNGGSVLGQSQFKTGIDVYVTVGQMMDQLTNFPSSGAVGFLEIFGLEGLNLLLQLCRKIPYLLGVKLDFLITESIHPLKSTDGKF